MRRRRVLLPWVVLAIYWGVLFTLTHLPRLPSVHVYGRDKTMHFGAYLILAVLLWWARYGRSERPSPRRLKAYIALFAIACYAGVDELTQELFGRSCSLGDWLSDVAGAVAGLGLLMCVRGSLSMLVLWWAGLFVVTHWPQSKPALIVLPGYLRQFHIAYVMAGYAVLTLLWWRTAGRQGRFVLSRGVAVLTAVVMGGYAVADEGLSALMGRAFDWPGLGGAVLGIGLGIACSAALGRHHIVQASERAGLS